MLTTEPVFSRKLGRNIVWGAILLTLLVQAAFIWKIKNGLSPLADGYSEANALRAADAYRTHGFRAHYGLPRILYGKLFPGQGSWSEPEQFKAMGLSDGPPDDVAYPHYPPGPDWIAGAMATLFGMDRIQLFRILPVSVVLLGMILFFTTVARYFGSDRAAVVALGCIAIPMFHSHSHGLHYQGYSFGLLLMQLAILIAVLYRNDGPRLFHYLALGLLGFLQGWLSFDQCFVVTFAVVPLWLLRRSSGGAASWKLLVVPVLVLGGAFTFAHVLHFMQVIGELGGVHAAVEDLRKAAVYRAGASDATRGRLGLFVDAARKYQSVLTVPFGNFGFGLPFLVVSTLVVAVLCVIRKVTLAVGRKEHLVAWHMPRGTIVVLLSALLVSLAWTLVMTQHAWLHTTIVARHYFVFYVVTLLVIVSAMHKPTESSSGNPA